jgi:hypothetical protein
MDARADGVGCESARPSDLFITKARDLSHQEDVTVEVWQCGERLVHCEIDILRRWSRGFHQPRRLGVPQTLAVVVEREVPGDLKQPGSHLAVRSHGDSCPAYPQEDVLRQVTRRFGLADRPAEVPEKTMLVGGEERCGVGGPAYY